MPLTGLEPAIPAIMRQQTYTLDRAVTVTGLLYGYRWVAVSTLKEYLNTIDWLLRTSQGGSYSY
jgi:hypothetical protein